MLAYLKADLVEELHKAGWTVDVTSGIRSVRQDFEVQLPRKIYVSSVNIVNRRNNKVIEFDLIKEKKIPSPVDAKKLFRLNR